VECCSASRIARDLEGAVEHERLIDYALLRAQDFVDESWGMNDEGMSA